MDGERVVGGEEKERLPGETTRGDAEEDDGVGDQRKGVEGDGASPEEGD